MTRHQVKWYESSTGNHQGLIIDEESGKNIAVTYDKADAGFIVRACNCHKALLQACKCALTGLQGVMPVYDPDGNRTNPAWETMKELKSIIYQAEEYYNEP